VHVTDRCKKHPAVCGGQKILNTIYQSCEPSKLPPITSETEDTQGIQIVGLHRNGIGNRRTIASLQSLLVTDYYLRDYHQPNQSCFDILKSPPIYDYGGKPYASVGSKATLNFFKDNGSGTEVLGTDCSGFVFSALAAGGLKVRKSVRLKPVSVNGISASMFFHPQESGLDCMDYATFDHSENLRSGDVLASRGHVVLIDSVGKDPLGIAKFHKSSQCTLENMDSKRFNFVLLQSSPSKGGIGVQRTRAADYFSTPGEEDMTKALKDEAVAACLAQTQTQKIQAPATTASLTRHLASQECSDAPVALDFEECISSCRASN
jgi:hypothetical protein